MRPNAAVVFIMDLALLAPVVFCELVKKCQNSEYKFSETSRIKLERSDVLRPDGDVEHLYKVAVLSNVKVSGNVVEIIQPLKNAPNPNPKGDEHGDG